MATKKNRQKKDSNVIYKSNLLFKYCAKEWHQIITANQVQLKIAYDCKIFSEGDLVKGIFIINSGKVKVVSVFDKDKERIHRLASEKKILGHRGIGSKKYTISAIALTDTIVTFMPMDIFNILLKTNPALSLFMIEFMAEELRNSEEQMKNMVQLEVKERIASILVTLINSFGYDSKESTKLSFTLSRKDIASIAGTTYETVIRTLAYLDKKKLIELVGKDIHIKNEKELKLFSVQNQ